MSNSAEITLEGLAVKVAPPAAVSGAVILGYTPAEWITILTVTYLLMSIGLLIPRYWSQFRDWYKAWKQSRKDEKDGRN